MDKIQSDAKDSPLREYVLSWDNAVYQNARILPWAECGRFSCVEKQRKTLCGAEPRP